MILHKHLINAILVLLQIDIFKVKNYVNAWNKKKFNISCQSRKGGQMGGNKHKDRKKLKNKNKKRKQTERIPRKGGQMGGNKHKDRKKLNCA